MSARLYGPINLDLADGPIRVDTSRGADGRQQARLVFGDLTQAVAIAVTNCPAETLQQLQEAVAQLIALQQTQARLATLPEVA
ncbi:hypothetical protein GCM10010348_77390 [Streptomyces anthocyanicus]|uniref:hypothetical protein n=1 Tax=Streptomyces anthocyanicus TaxID=68174 RepID=UPI001875B346|nr:hypothetical protein [Streptomyces anthocyanicus]GHC38547.1 hypothetical protein GCM10010348_77390 [Streptomyces anthocyanicus]